MAQYITVDGENTIVTPHNGTDFSLDELKSFVNGYIEIVWYGANLPSTHVLIVNEMGWVLDPPLRYNAVASVIAGQPIAGNVLYCERIYLR